MQTSVPGPEFAPDSERPDIRRPEALGRLRSTDMAVVHGGKDRNCPVEETVDLVAAMRDAGFPVLFLLDDEVGHDFPQDPEIRARYLEWLQAAISEKPDAPVDARR